MFYRIARHHQRRVTLLCPEINPVASSNGTRLALHLAVETANRMQADLRLISTQAPVAPHALHAELKRQGLAVMGECSLHTAAHPGQAIEFDRFDGELILAATCRCANEACCEVPAEDLVCLLHPDDPDLQHAAADPTAIEAMPGLADMRFVVCGQSFKQHLVGRGFAHALADAPSFEPEGMGAVPALGDDERSLFLFEVVPPIDRQRFARGLEAVEQALALRVLDPQRWDFLFATPGLPRVVLGHGLTPTSLEDLSPLAAWQAWQRASLVLRLGPPDTNPHSSMGVAAPNAVFVLAGSNSDVDTRQTPITPAPPGVIHCDLTREAIVDALGRAGALLSADRSPHDQAAPAGIAQVQASSLQAMAAQLAAGR
ncbi:MAG: hypothetical protein LC125_04905 [Burkholderiales bacterium]|nr:hypothetical protein [Burkholderiales bacterium]